MNAKEFYIKQQLEGKTDDITSNPNPDYSLDFYQQIFSLMEGYKQVRVVPEVSHRDIQQKLDVLKKAAEPLLKYLCENYHPHVTAIVTGTSVELLEGIMSIPKIFDHVVD